MEFCLTFDRNEAWAQTPKEERQVFQACVTRNTKGFPNWRFITIKKDWIIKKKISLELANCSKRDQWKHWHGQCRMHIKVNTMGWGRWVLRRSHIYYIIRTWSNIPWKQSNRGRKQHGEEGGTRRKILQKATGKQPEKCQLGFCKRRANIFASNHSDLETSS